MRKIVDATKGSLSVTNAELAISRLELVTMAPNPDVVVPHWRVVLSLSTGGELLALVTKEFAFNINVNPVQTIKNNISAADLAGWTVTRIVDGA